MVSQRFLHQFQTNLPSRRYCNNFFLNFVKSSTDLLKPSHHEDYREYYLNIIHKYNDDEKSVLKFIIFFFLIQILIAIIAAVASPIFADEQQQAIEAKKQDKRGALGLGYGAGYYNGLAGYSGLGYGGT